MTPELNLRQKGGDGLKVQSHARYIHITQQLYHIMCLVQDNTEGSVEVFVITTFS